MLDQCVFERGYRKTYDRFVLEIRAAEAVVGLLSLAEVLGHTIT